MANEQVPNGQATNKQGMTNNLKTAPSTVFPDGFLWGVATAAHQVEGNNTNSDIWLLEHVEGSAYAEPSGDAINHYNRYPEDIALIASLGFTSYRFSLEWSRIEPAEGLFSQAALDHYRAVIDCCHAHDLKAIVTLHHFTSPIWLLARGGWESDETPRLFARYCSVVMNQLGDAIDICCTMNEPNLAWVLADAGFSVRDAELRAHDPMLQGCGRALGKDPRTLAQFQFAATPKAYEIKCAAHHAAVAVVHEKRPGLKVGWTLASSHIVAAPGGAERADRARAEINTRFFHEAAQDDFIGIQIYTRSWYGPEGPVGPPEGSELNQQGEEFYPEALEAVVREAWNEVHVPLLVTENGIPTEDDHQRVRYLERAVAGVARCLADDIPVLGYTCWSAFDNFEWVFGYRPRYGLIGVDRTTQRRAIKPSAIYLGAIARSNGADIDGKSIA